MKQIELQNEMRIEIFLNCLRNDFKKISNLKKVDNTFMFNLRENKFLIKIKTENNRIKDITIVTQFNRRITKINKKINENSIYEYDDGTITIKRYTFICSEEELKDHCPEEIKKNNLNYYIIFLDEIKFCDHRLLKYTKSKINSLFDEYTNFYTKSEKGSDKYVIEHGGKLSIITKEKAKKKYNNFNVIDDERFIQERDFLMVMFGQKINKLFNELE
jgi:hypothetical protein